jgi:hypothetical protein
MSDEAEKQEESADVNEIKHSVENIIGVDTTLRKRKPTAEDRQREQFIAIIIAIEQTIVRSQTFERLGLDLAQYEEDYYRIIDEQFMLMFGVEIAKIIMFYLYARFDDDGNRVGLMEADEKTEIVLNDPNDLWKAIRKKSEEKKERKKKKSNET